MVDLHNPTIGELQNSQFGFSCPPMENDAPEYAEIGERLRAIRLGFSDMNQKAWAQKNGFSVTQYNNWEKGTRRIPVDAAERLSDTYGLTLDAIYRGRLDGLSEKARNAF